MTQQYWTSMDVFDSSIFQTLLHNGICAYKYKDNPIIGLPNVVGDMTYYKLDKYLQYIQSDEYLLKNYNISSGLTNPLFFYIIIDQPLAQYIADNTDIKGINENIPNDIKNFHPFKIFIEGHPNEIKVITMLGTEILTTTREWYGIRIYIPKQTLPQWYF